LRVSTLKCEAKKLSTKIIIISDTHGLHEDVLIPDGDVLIHAGDFTAKGALSDVEVFNHFLGRLPHRHKIVIAGNHEHCFERTPHEARALLTNAIYLQDECVTIEGVSYYGSPWQPWFFDWAFNLKRGAALKAKWDSIPEETDVLITHGPPAGVADVTAGGLSVGCEDLLNRVALVKPTLHAFGHIHEGYGVKHSESTTFVNASICDFEYAPVNPAIEFVL